MAPLRLKIFFILFFVVLLAALATLQGCAGLGRNGEPGTGPPPPVTTPPPPPPPPPPAGPSVLTYHNDNGRTGLNANETILTHANVNASQFGRVFSFDVDGQVIAQPLYLQNVSIQGQGTFNVVFVATEHDSVYAFDADGKVPGPLWKTSLLDKTEGITTVPSSDVGSTVQPEIGITGTPVIDDKTGTLYLVAFTKQNGAYSQKLHALDITTGDERASSPVEISGSVSGTGDGSSGGTLAFDPEIELQRSGLLLANGKIYVAFASHGDNGPYHGWVFAYDAASLQRTAIWNATPDGNDGGIWMGGSGLAADGDGAIYGITGNGNFNASSGGHNYGDTFLKLKSDLSGITDYFTPFNQQSLSGSDVDLGSGGAMLIPDQPGAHAHLVTGAGKEGRIYLVDRDNMGHFHAGDDSQIVQSIADAVGTGAEDRSFSTPAYWNGFVYYGGSFDNLKAFQLNNGQFSATPSSKSGFSFGFQGTTPTVSANGTKDAIVWAVGQNGAGLRAFDATNLANELYNSNQNATRDHLDTVSHFIVPTVANGRVYVGTKTSLVVYGLLP